jgi:phage tail-like protein
MPVAMSPTEKPLTAARYSITIDGHEIATFSQLSAITSEVEPVEYLESSGTGVVANKLPGKRKPPTVTLRRSKNSSTELWTWQEAVLRGDLAKGRRNCSLSMFDPEGKQVAQYWLAQAWPSKLEIGAVKSGATEVLTETVTLVCESIQRTNP